MTEPRPTGVFWSEPDLRIVEACWARGESASEIASRLRGRSRNSIISAVSRYRFKRCGDPALSSVPALPVPTRMARHHRKAHLASYLATQAAPITLAGPAWSHPGRAAA